MIVTYPAHALVCMFFLEGSLLELQASFGAVLVPSSLSFFLSCKILLVRMYGFLCFGLCQCLCCSGFWISVGGKGGGGGEGGDEESSLVLACVFSVRIKRV